MAPPAGWGRRPRPAERRGATDERRVYRVAEVGRAVRDTLGRKFKDFWVEGELSQVHQSRSGHVYFQLSDEREVAAISGVVFQRSLDGIEARLVDGERVRVRASVDFYVQRGQVQLQVKTMLPAGDGDLAARFLAIRKRLADDGLLDESRKRPLPRAPLTIGVVTSATSAALRDILRVTHARAPIRIVVADCRTSGDQAPRSIVVALEAIQKLTEVEVILLARGGGSAEELWSFNDEAVCRAVAASRVPVVCGVGHESDHCLAEAVADVRASTPSNAAEKAVPEWRALWQELDTHERRLQSALAANIDRGQLRLAGLLRRLGDPRRSVLSAHRHVEALDRRLAEGTVRAVGAERERLGALLERLRRRDPRAALEADAERLRVLERRLRRAIDRQLARTRAAHERRAQGGPRAMARMLARRQRDHARRVAKLQGLGRPAVARARARLGGLGGRLDALSPLRVLGRGYGIAFGPEGKALRSASAVSVGDAIRVRLHAGELHATVDRVQEGE
jgi:exodeoxyribonuclease VII large subunit